MLTVSELFVYPIKSLRGVSLRQAHVTDRGLQYDRRWMLIDSQNRFLTQREHPQMALLTVLIGIDGLAVTHPEIGTIRVPFKPTHSNAEEVLIWEDRCKAVLMGSDFDAWFSAALAINCRLVYMPDSAERQVDQRYATKGAITSFSDGYPFLLIGQASLDDLNRRLETPVSMNRFRPNIVFTGAVPFEEDRMNHIRIGDKIDFYGVKLCARCVMTTIDQENGKKSKEPLKTLALYRSKGKKILFGQNLIHQGSGIIEVGDTLVVLSKHIEERFMV